MKFSNIIYEMILREYNEKLLNQIIKKFQEEAPGLDTNIIRIYINRFVQIKNSPNVTEKDITKYTWKQLETVVDSNQPKRIKAGKINDGEPGGDSNLVYNENGLRIYIGKTKNACIKYGNGYSFCISSRGEGNLYFDYRHRRKGTPYFIFDDTKPSGQNSKGEFINPFHLLVLFVYEHTYDKGTFWYTITTADNTDEKEYDYFDEIEKDFSKLRGLEELFKPIAMDPKEKGEYELGKKYQELLNDLNDKLDSVVSRTYVDEDAYVTNFQFGNFKNAIKDIDRKIGLYKFTAVLKNPSDKVNYNDYLKDETVTIYKIGADEDPKNYYSKFINMMKMFGEDNYESITTKRIIQDFDLKYNKIEGESSEIYTKYLNDVKELVDQYRSDLTKINLLS
jgi:hypothetical protein